MYQKYVIYSGSRKEWKMKQKTMDQITDIVINNSFVGNILSESQCGFILVNKDGDKIEYINEMAKDLFRLSDSNDFSSIRKIIDENNYSKLLEQQSISISHNNDKLELSATSSNEYVFILINDRTPEQQIKKETTALRKLNNKLQSVFENYNDDTICIADKNGIVEFSGEACERHCGITAKDIIGKNMLELEKQKYFYPSATGKVLKSKKTEVVMSDTLIGVTLITIGVPVFDESGEISKVITISRDFSKELEIAALLTRVKADVLEEDEQVETKTIITCSNKIYSILTLLKMVAPSESTVLITGETGTGKGLFAKYIYDNSKRADKPFFSINCGSIAENIIESELFGYAPSSFTGADKEGRQGLFEMAQGGTIFLDEIGELPLSQQVKLLHVLQEKKIIRVGGREYIDVDVRVIAATNKDLPKMVEDGTFREDLYYRLNVVSVYIPPLKDRKEDIPLLIKHFLQQMNVQNATHKEISSSAIEIMAEYEWPGNVRELENIIEMLSVTTSDHIIGIEHLPDQVKNIEVSDNTDKALVVNKVMPLKDGLKSVEIQMIEKALKECNGNQYEAAKLLSVDRSTITRKVNQYNIKYK